MKNAEQPKLGAYVLATKFYDGDPADAWAIGFYTGQSLERQMVEDGMGVQCRASGYQYVAEISGAVGEWLYTNRAIFERSPPGAVNIWGMVQIDPYSYRRFTPASRNDRQVELLKLAVRDEMKEQ